MSRILLGLALLSGSVFAETVRFKTVDGLEIVADYYEHAPGAPTVICIPMYRNVRASYAPLVAPLEKRGLNMLAIDARGHGDSAPDLAAKVTGRDPELFRAMHKDVAAALRFLARRGADTTRVGLIGASVGCSVAVDATVRAPHAIRAVTLLTPGSAYLGVLTLEHLERWPGTRVLTLYSEEEKRTSEKVAATLAMFPASKAAVLSPKGIHGTRMFGKVEGIEDRIAAFQAEALGNSADLRVPRWSKSDPATRRPGFFSQVLRPARKVGDTTFTLMAWVVGDTWHFGALVDRPFRGKVRFSIDGRSVEFPFDSAKKGEVAGTDGVVGQQAGFRDKTWITFERSGVKPEGCRLSLTFQPIKGDVARLPSGDGHFAAVRHRRP